MKKLSLALIVMLAAGAVSAQMSDWEQTASLVTTNSDSWSQFIRGTLEGVHVNVAAKKTNVVLITSEDDQTLFSATVSADAFYPILVPAYGTTGSALTESYSIWNNITNSVGTNPIYTKLPVASKVTMRVAGAADTTGTNSVTVRLIWKP